MYVNILFFLSHGKHASRLNRLNCQEWDSWLQNAEKQVVSWSFLRKDFVFLVGDGYQPPRQNFIDPSPGNPIKGRMIITNGRSLVPGTYYIYYIFIFGKKSPTHELGTY